MKLKKAATGALFVLGLIALPLPALAESFLVENGEPRAVIVIAEEPSPRANLAVLL